MVSLLGDAAQSAPAPHRTAPEQPLPACSAPQPAARAPPLLPALAPADAQALMTLFTALVRRQADPSAAEVTSHEQQNHECTAQAQSLCLCPPIVADPDPGPPREHRTPIPVAPAGNRSRMDANPGRGD